MAVVEDDLMIKRMGCRMISDTRYLNNFLSPTYSCLPFVKKQYFDLNSNSFISHRIYVVSRAVALK
jgi:hypothetical protein